MDVGQCSTIKDECATALSRWMLDNVAQSRMNVLQQCQDGWVHRSTIKDECATANLTECPFFEKVLKNRKLNKIVLQDLENCNIFVLARFVSTKCLFASFCCCIGNVPMLVAACT